MLKRKVPFYIVITAILVTTVFSFFIFSQTTKQAEVIVSTAPENQCTYNIARLSGYNYISPLVSAEPACESVQMNPAKTEIQNIITSDEGSGVLTSASVYLREFNDGDWIFAGEERKYDAGSLLKVPEMIALLRMNEEHPGFIDKKITYSNEVTTDKHPVFLSKSIELGHTYTIRELIKYMISYSDNNATGLLTPQLDPFIFFKVFTDLGLSKPDSQYKGYPITAKEYSIFMKALYNASYLTIDDSEFCTELLSNCDFSDGMISGLPAGCKVAHKFGEAGFTNNPELSESGIVFLNNNAYILTVMTQGPDIKKLAGVIGDISKAAYEKMTTYNASGTM
jgi:beta-lactamase class A